MYSTDLTIPGYLLQMKEFTMNEKVVIALVMSYKEHGCPLKKKEIAQTIGISPKSIGNIIYKLENMENPVLKCESEPSLLYYTEYNSVLQNYLDSIVLYYNTYNNNTNNKRKRIENKIEECLYNTSSLKNIPLFPQRKEKEIERKARLFEFEEFWRSYPKQSRLNKTRCYQLYYKAKDGGASAAMLHTALESWKQGKLWKEGYVCHCRKWLNQEYYLQHPEPFDDSWSKMW